MNLAETNDLLTFIALYDNRRLDDATVLAWRPIVADLDLDDARAAVIRHFATSDDYLMPVHIRRGVDELQRERARAAREAREAEQKALEAADPTRRHRSDGVSAILDNLRAALPEGNPDTLRYGTRYWREQRERHQARPNPNYDPGALSRLDQILAEFAPAETTSEQQP